MLCGSWCMPWVVSPITGRCPGVHYTLRKMMNNSLQKAKCWKVQSSFLPHPQSFSGKTNQSKTNTQKANILWFLPKDHNHRYHKKGILSFLNHNYILAWSFPLATSTYLKIRCLPEIAAVIQSVVPLVQTEVLQAAIPAPSLQLVC